MEQYNEVAETLIKNITQTNATAHIIDLIFEHCIKNDVSINKNELAIFINEDSYVNYSVIYNGVVYSEDAYTKNFVEEIGKRDDVNGFADSYGVYLNNIIILNIDAFFKDLKAGQLKRGYNIDIRHSTKENIMCLFLATLLHEILHHVMSSANSSMNVELRYISDKLQRALNKDSAMLPLGANTQEVIAHSLTNYTYMRYLITNKDVLTDINTYLSLLSNKNFVNFLNAFTNDVFEVDLFEFAPSTTEDFLSRKYYEVKAGNVLGDEFEAKNRWGENIFKVKDNGLLDTKINELCQSIKTNDNIAKSHTFVDDRGGNNTLQSLTHYRGSYKTTELPAQQTDEGVSFYDIIHDKKYNNITSEELHSYVHCEKMKNENLNISLYLKEIEYSLDACMEFRTQMLVNKDFANEKVLSDVPTIIYNGITYTYFAEYFNGKTNSKYKILEENKDVVIDKYGEGYYNAVVKVHNDIDTLFVDLTNEDSSMRYQINLYSPMITDAGLVNCQGSFYGSENVYDKEEPISLLRAYKHWINTDKYNISLYGGVRPEEIRAYLSDSTRITNEKGDKFDKDDSMAKEFKYNAIINALYNSFSDFIAKDVEENVLEQIRANLSYTTDNCFGDISKIPVGWVQNKGFKASESFKLSIAQRDAIAFKELSNRGVLLGYDVGVGKTLACIMAIMSSFEKGTAKKALITVPEGVYVKWLQDIRGYSVKDKNGKMLFYKGAVPHDKVNVVELHNLNYEVVSNLKVYSEHELQAMETAKDFHNHALSCVDKVDKAKLNVNDFRKIVNQILKHKHEVDTFSDLGMSQGFNVDTFIEMYVQNDELGEVEDEQSEKESLYGQMLTDIVNAIEEYSLRLAYISGSFPEFPDRTIFVANHTIFKRLGYSIEHIDIVSEIYKNIITDENPSDAQLKDALDFSKMLLITSGTAKLNIEELGIDYLAVDEAHVGKNLLKTLEYKFDKDIKSDSKGGIGGNGDRTYISKIKGAGKQSAVAVQLFALSVYVQNASKFKNVLLLTATPFTNNSLEIFTMLSMTDYEYLRDCGYEKVKDFAYQFIVGRYELVLTVRGDIKSEFVEAGFRNLNELQRIVMTIIDYKTGFDANVDRPCKITLPIENTREVCGEKEELKFDITKPIRTMTNPSLEQKLVITAVQKLIKKGDSLSAIFDNYLSGIILEDFDEFCKYDNSFPNADAYLAFNGLATVFAERLREEYLAGVKPKMAELVLTAKCLAALRNVSLSPIMVSGAAEFIEILPNRDLSVSNVDKLIDADIPMDIYIRSIFYNLHKKNGFFDERVGDFDEGQITKMIGRIINKMNGDRYNYSIISTFKTVAEFALYVSIIINMPAVDVEDALVRLLENAEQDKVTVRNFAIEKSSKIMYVLESIKSANKFFDAEKIDRKGFVIYSNLGTSAGKNSPFSFIELMRDYMLDESKGFGYKANEVRLLTGKTSKTARPNLIRSFNEGETKVVITTVKEGVDLNGNTTGLFNISVDWNPTDAKQIEGRAWRQGNRNAYCVINYPLLSGSADGAIYQKLQEKTHRLAQIWNRENRRSQFDLGEFNPEELKLKMIDDVAQISAISVIKTVDSIKREEVVAKDVLKSMRNSRLIYNNIDIRLRTFRALLSIAYNVDSYMRICNSIIDKSAKYRSGISNIDFLRNEIKKSTGNSPQHREISALRESVVEKENELRNLGSEYALADASEQDSIVRKINAIKKEIENLNEKAEGVESMAEKSDEVVELEKALSKQDKEVQELKKEIIDLLKKANKPYTPNRIEVPFSVDNHDESNYFFGKSRTQNTIRHYTYNEKTATYEPLSEDYNKDDYDNVLSRLSDMDWSKATLKDCEYAMYRYKVQEMRYGGSQKVEGFEEYGTIFDFEKYFKKFIDEIKENHKLPEDYEGNFDFNNFMRARKTEFYSIAYYKDFLPSRSLIQYRNYFGSATEEQVEQIITEQEDKVIQTGEMAKEFDFENVDNVKKVLARSGDILAERRSYSSDTSILVEEYMSLSKKFLVEKLKSKSIEKSTTQKDKKPKVEDKKTALERKIRVFNSILKSTKDNDKKTALERKIRVFNSILKMTK